MTSAGAGVCVIGGGLAGIAAALRLAETGVDVTLLEARPHLGGATYSFERDGLTLDTGQHVFLRGFRDYRRLLDRLGTARHTVVQPRFTVPVVAPGRDAVLLRRARLPAPAHLLPALAGYRLLNPAARVMAARAAAALRRVDPDDPAIDAQSFGRWLAAHGQRPPAVRRLWALVAVAALNADIDHASLALAARVFQAGLLSETDAGDIGRPLVPLRQLHAEPAQQLLRRLGAQLHTRTKVRQVWPEPGGGFRIHTDGATLSADAVVLAVPHRAAARLLPPTASPLAHLWHKLGSSPIVNVHLRYAAPVTTLSMAAAVDSAAQWIFDRSMPELDGQQHLVVSLSAADAELSRPSGELVAEQHAAIARLFPAARRTGLTEAFVSREPYATFRQAPGTRQWRPPPRTHLPGLALAGAWTDTGWPDTMEGAVRSGHAAAEVIGSHLARPRPMEAAR